MKGNRFDNDNEVVITSDEIKIILDRYRIGKKPLAKLLGWGETTIIRYMEGDIPTNEYSNKLKVLFDDPEFYYDLLVKRKDCLTGVAFKKSKKAVLSKIMASKIYAIAYYIVNKSNAEICATYIQYLLYYIQAFSLALYDEEVFEEECMVNQEHIPFPKLYESMKRNGIRTIDVSEEYITDEEKLLVDAVYDSYSWYGPKALSALTTYEKTLIKISRDRYNNKIISKDTLKTYFRDVLSQYHILSYKDIINYPESKLREFKEMNI